MSEFWQGFGAGVMVSFIVDWAWVFAVSIWHALKKKGPLFCVISLLCASSAFAQTITCMPTGQSTACYNGQGGSTTITPMGQGFYSYGNSNGQMGTIYTPPTPSPMPFTPLPSQSRPFPPSLNGQRFVR